MLEKTFKQKDNPTLAFLKEQANAKGIPFDSLCEGIGYSPKVIEALEENAWFKSSDETLVLNQAFSSSASITLDE